jgi:hypothetical protein
MTRQKKKRTAAERRLNSSAMQGEDTEAIPPVRQPMQEHIHPAPLQPRGTCECLQNETNILLSPRSHARDDQLEKPRMPE